MNLEQELDAFNDQLKTDFESDAEHFDLENSNLDSCMIMQPKLQNRWEKHMARAVWLERETDRVLDEATADAYREIRDNSNERLTSTDIKTLIPQDPVYRDAVILHNKATRTRKEVEGMLKTVETRKYILKDYVSARINEVHRTVI